MSVASDSAFEVFGREIVAYCRMFHCCLRLGNEMPVSPRGFRLKPCSMKAHRLRLPRTVSQSMEAIAVVLLLRDIPLKNVNIKSSNMGTFTRGGIECLTERHIYVDVIVGTFIDRDQSYLSNIPYKNFLISSKHLILPVCNSSPLPQSINISAQTQRSNPQFPIHHRPLCPTLHPRVSTKKLSISLRIRRIVGQLGVQRSIDIFSTSDSRLSAEISKGIENCKLSTGETSA